MARQIPITVVTGFLGSGKTTLIRSVLSRAGEERQLHNMALIENEFAVAFGVENELLEGDHHNHNHDLKWIYEFGNGCICCSARGQVGRALQELLERPGDPIEHVLIETTGLSGATGIFHLLSAAPCKPPPILKVIRSP